MCVCVYSISLFMHLNIYIFIILILLSIIQLVNGMVLYEGATTTLGYLVQKLLRYKHHKTKFLQRNIVN